MPKKNKKEESSSDSDSGPDDREPVRKKPKADSNSFRTNDEEPTWDLGKNRFAKVSEFKGKIYINIREFYNADGDLKPGKKGIMLTPEQWNRLKVSVEEIDEEIKKRA
ncbi:activated RNA polymerase II transcriptional coactivator p15 [Cylas formicarius]|uniref:activated RNA polymerase II transcriptional coactivator p15 n=1 Tax=Cylas formicarius TaxID=197179 RepID=UPI002958755A|nr:activated RNA polymerase II transcriptional coactivator p15 [Cylas formicarius]